MPSWRNAAASPSRSAGSVDLVVGVLVHEHQAVAIGIEVLEVLGVEPDALDGVGAAEADVGLAAVDQVLHLDLHEGAALARLGMLGLGDLPDAFFVFEDVAGTNVHAADLHGGKSPGKRRCELERGA